jgi:hypothetical protein
MYVQQMKIIQIIHAHMHVDKSHAKIHIQLLGFFKQVLEIPHSLHRPHHLSITFTSRIYLWIGPTL